MRTPGFLTKLLDFYKDSFKSMTVGKTLWTLVLIKLFIMFIVLKIFFFPNYLNTNFHDEKSKADHVREQLIDHRLH